MLLEREDVLSELTLAFAEVRGGAGVVVLVTGEAGIGKSSVVSAFVATIDGQARVLRGASDDLGVPPPLGPFLDIASTLPRLASRLESGPSAAPAAVLSELRREPPTVCIVEDAHWADDATIDVLTHIVRRIGDTGLLLLITYRDDEIGSDHPFRRALGAVAPGTARRLDLQPLSLAAARALAAAGPARHDLEDLYAVTGGNPFFLTEVLAAEGDRTPHSVTDAVLSRLAGISADARALVELVSVVPGRMELDLLRRCLPGALEPALAEAERAGALLVDRRTVGFRHELARRAVEEALTATDRTALNTQVLNALVATGDAGSARLAHHAWQIDDGDTFLAHGRAAAEEAIARRSHREAAELLDRAAHYIDRLPPEQQLDVLDRRAEEAYVVGDGNGALEPSIRAAALAEQLGDRNAASRSLLQQARIRWLLGDGDGADAAAERAVALVADQPPCDELAMGLSVRSRLAMLKRRVDDAIAWGSRAMEIATDLQDDVTLAHAMTNVGTAMGMSGDVAAGHELLERAAQLARERGVDEEYCRALVNLAWTAVDAFDHRRGREAVGRSLAYALDHDMGGYIRYCEATLAQIDLLTGDWESASARADALLENPEMGADVTRIAVSTVCALIAVRRGVEGRPVDLEDAWQFAIRTGELQRIRPVAAARGEAAWLAGDLQGVDDATRAAYALALDVGARGSDLGELAMLRFRAGLLDGAPPGVGPVYALEMSGDAATAAAMWEEIGQPYEQALALMTAGGRDALVRAIAILDRLGAAPAATMARRRLRELGEGAVPLGPRASTRGNPLGLTSRQIEVLALIVEGRSNPEIATALVVSPKTVEHHVAAVLAKLGVRNRREVATAARDLGVVTRP